MFETADLSSGPATKRFWSTCAGIAGEVLVLGCAVLAPILSPQSLPRAMFATMLTTPGPPPAPPRPPGPMVRPARTHVLRTLAGLITPTVIPRGIPRIVEAPETTAAIGIPGGTEGGSSEGVNNGLLTSILSTNLVPVTPPLRTAAPAPAAGAPPASVIQRFKAGGLVQLAEPIYRPEPQYPPLARQMRVSGTVELEGIIGTDGHLRELRVVRGHPLLARAALEAVSKWIYKPTKLNGDPVEVIAPITVAFHLN